MSVTKWEPNTHSDCVLFWYSAEEKKLQFLPGTRKWAPTGTRGVIFIFSFWPSQTKGAFIMRVRIRCLFLENAQAPGIFWNVGNASEYQTIKSRSILSTSCAEMNSNCQDNTIQTTSSKLDFGLLRAPSFPFVTEKCTTFKTISFLAEWKLWAALT